MSFLPIAQRELRLAARRGRTYWFRAAAGLLAAGTALSILSPSMRGLQPTTVTGAQLFQVLAVSAFVLCLFAGTFITADCLSAEKREGTLGLLFLTPLRGYDVILGKLLATALNPFYGLIAALPVLALPIVLGGVTPGEYGRLALVLTNTLFFSLAAGMLVSAVSHNGHKALAGTLLFIAAWTLVPFVDVVWSGRLNLRSPLAALSPATGFVLAFERNLSSPAFGLSSGLTQLLGWVWLALASSLLPQCLQDAPVKAREPGAWLTRPARLARGLSSPQQRVAESAATQDKAKRVEQRGDDPLLWLARRERYRHTLFWVFIGVAALAWLAGYGRFGALWFRAELVFGTTFVLHSIIKCWAALEASRRLAQGRQSGELELLLVTPLDVSQIVIGRMVALKRFFLVPLGLVLGADLGLLLFGIQSPAWMGNGALWTLGFLATIGIFVTDCYAMSWVGLWHGLTAANPTQAFLKTLFKVLVLPWVIFIAGLALLPVVSVLVDLNISPIAWWVFVNVTSCFGLCTWARNHLEHDFRGAVVCGLEPEATRFAWRHLLPRTEAMPLAARQTSLL